ncbi:hypothetical protein [Amycolatopsis sp. NPDC051371]|uniref:hypothetical protein n=1 Tax=Amycolatopsis sp. NPDC051371 TaxID=3155800 RepID=UPI0034231CB2
MRIQTKRTLQVALVSGGLLVVGTGSASAAETVNPDVPASPVDQLVTNPGPVQTLTTVLAATRQGPAPAADAPAPAAVLHAVPVLQHDPAPSAEVSGDLPEQHLNAPLGSELAATDLPVLPLTATADTVPGRATVTPVDGRLPLHGNVSTQPLIPGAGTRVTGLRTSTAPVGAVQPAYDRRADAPAAGLPLLGGLLPSTDGVLPSGCRC